MPEANEGSLSPQRRITNYVSRSGNRADGQLADQIGGSARVLPGQSPSLSVKSEIL